MPKHKYNLIIPVGLKPRPDNYEEKVAEFMANYFKSDIKFVVRNNNTTPDVLVVKLNQRWEIKNIRGNSKRTIQNNLREADDQSDNVVISLLRTSMTESQAIGRTKQYMREGRIRIRKLMLVSKTGKIIVIL